MKKANRNAPPADESNTRKDPENWTTGDEPMTGAQRSYLHTLSDEAGEQPDDSLSKAEASEEIDRLRDGTVDARSDDDSTNTRKDPKDWKTGDEPMTGAQRSYLQTLSEEAGVELDPELSKAEASKRIDELRKQNPRTA